MRDEGAGNGGTVGVLTGECGGLSEIIVVTLRVVPGF